ncbi:MAG: hypothetical protein Q4F78_07230 [Bacillota bacterium]|nr:hypothetical protein [Bacillota bacterium]
MIIEKITKEYLEGKVSVPVYMEKPEDEPDEFIIIEKTGGSKGNHIKSASLALQSHADSLYRAAELNEEVKAAMDDIIALDEIASVDLARDYNFTDTTKKKHRYQAIYDLVHY